MTSKAGNDWRSILLAIASAGGAVSAVALAMVVVVYQTAMMFGGEQQQSLFDKVVLASAILFVGALLIPAAYYSVRCFLGKEVAANAIKPMNFLVGSLIILIWLGIVAGTQFFYNNEILRWLTPPLYILSIALPVYFFARLATGGLNFGSRQRTWGALGSGMLIGPTFAAFFEVTLVVILLVGIGIYAAFHPQLFSAFDAIKQQLNNASTPNDILNLVSPYLLNPLAIATAFLFFSVAAPLIEETAKSLTTWTIFDRLSSPAQGFVIGALSGTGFGLVESLLASVQPDSSWAVTLLVRGGTTMMHIVTASLTGWGIASFHANKSTARMIGMYLLAMFLHGIWNACVIAVVVGAERTALAVHSADPIGIALMVLGLIVMACISIIIPIALSVINWRFRTAVSVSLPPEAMQGEIRPANI